MRDQRGLTLTSFLFWAVILALVGVIGLRMAPAYAEYFEVKKTMEYAMTEYNGQNAQSVRRNYDLKASAGYSEDVVKGKDIEFSRENNQLVMSVSWTKKLPVVANVSLLLDFDVTVKK
jgi:hypothetical protein